MAKERIYELAKELKMPSKSLVKVAKDQGMDIKSHMSSVTPDQAQKLRQVVKGNNQKGANQPKQQAKHHEKNSQAKAGHKGNKQSTNQANHNKKNEHHDQKHHDKNHSSKQTNQNNNRHQNDNNGRFGGSLNESGRKGKRFNKKNKKRNKKHNNNGRLREVKHQQPTQRKDKPLPDVLEYTEGMNAQDLGKILHRSPAEIIKKLFMLGVMINQNQSLDKDTIELLATDYGIEAKEKVEEDISDIDKMFEEEQNNTDHLVSRPPVVTVMGHVDHGKTTLLDKLRHSHVTEHEAGGITQEIGAYQVHYKDNLITFLDTPGHAAFTEMRARGANITDITVLVVAADDGVMPQTVEAIHHAQAAKTPIIVAVNKIDKPGANPERVIEELAKYNLIPEDWGGDTIFVNISAKFGKNIDELLDMIQLQAEMMELKANPDQNAAGSVVEARLDQGKGSVATVLVQQGTLHVGDPIVVGNTYGRVRTMTNENGRRIKEATPSTPVEITGLNSVPEAGDRFIVFDDEKTARAAGEKRAEQAQEEERKRTSHVTLDNLFDTMKKGQMKTLPLIIKADVQGSVEALSQSLQKIKVDGVRVDIIHQAVGAINESDVTLAEASNAVIIGFNVRPTSLAKSLADSNKIDIRLHQVIYNAIEEVEDAMKGMLEPIYEEKVIGHAEIRQIFKASGIGNIAGSYVLDGSMQRGCKARVTREGKQIFEGPVASLKRFKDDVKEVKAGYECGLVFDGFNEIAEGDQVEAYIMVEVPR